MNKLEWKSFYLAHYPNEHLGWRAKGLIHTYEVVKNKRFMLLSFILKIEYGNACPFERDSRDSNFLYQCAQFHEDQIVKLLKDNSYETIKKSFNS